MGRDNRLTRKSIGLPEKCEKLVNGRALRLNGLNQIYTLRGAEIQIFKTNTFIVKKKR